MVVVNHLEKKISVVDLKTMEGPIINFPENVRKFDYLFQLAFYKIAVSSFFKKELEEGYTLEDFSFVVQSKSHINSPVTFLVKQETLDTVIEGTPDKYYQGNLIKRGLPSFSKLVEDFKYYIQTGFKADRIIEENNCVLTLDINYNILENGIESKSTL
jgi:hypothetical protein